MKEDEAKENGAKKEAWPELVGKSTAEATDSIKNDR